MKQHGFLIAERASRWQVAFPGQDGAEEFATKAEAEAARAAWKSKEKAKKDEEFKRLVEERAREREEFRAGTTLEIVTVHNPAPFQVDFRKPTVSFPDGSAIQFEPQTAQGAIEARVEEKAVEVHPEPDRDHPDYTVPEPPIEEIRIWEAELVFEGERRPLPDIRAWDHFFPAEAVTATLNALAEEGWSVAHVSEDRGLYGSDVAMNRSAPVLVRYLLVRERPA